MKQNKLSFQFERDFLSWVTKHLNVITFLAITFFGLVLRYMLRNQTSGDLELCLLPWFDKINDNDFRTNLLTQVGNYNLLYQLFISILTYIPLRPILSYKLLSCIFDFLLALIVMKFVYILQTKESNVKKEKATEVALFAYAAIVFCPIVFLNSAAWGQCDSIYVFFIVFSLYQLYQERYAKAFILLGLSFAFKLQMVFILPFYCFIYLVKKDFSILYFFLIPLTHLVTAIPNLLAGRSVLDLLKIYYHQTNTFRKITMNYPGFWSITNANYDNFSRPAIVITIVILGLLMYYFMKKKVTLTGDHMLYIAFLLTFACILFLPAMHERYGYLYEILAFILVFRYRKTLPLLIGLVLITIRTYSHYLFGIQIRLDLLGIINITIFLCYLVYFNFIMNKEEVTQYQN
ncbi:MAG: hypothetical protein PUC65_07355 [Clostridiales bacterium]|nr:hypothetical protein [Clostridiales bacterium]